MAAALLKTKLFIPPPRTSLVFRPRVTAQLTAGLDGKFTVVSAPAGFGKSTALSSWAATIDRHVAWLSLDETDNQPVQFWRYVWAALQKVAPQIGDSLGLDVDSGVNGAGQLEAGVISLINEITAVQNRLLLIVDDYHVISASDVNETFGFFIERLPKQLHITLSGRTDPPWPLARARARGELTELRTKDLRFTTEETAAFLRDVMGLELSPTQIEMLEERTEGWIAGLQMAALSMQDREDLAGFINALSGSHRFIMDYLLEEVLSKQSESVRDFLLETSILGVLTASLCDAVTDRTDSEQMLAQLEQANLFLTAQDNRRQWYRYHHLFADLLVSRQGRLQPDRIQGLHRRASLWYSENGQLGEAMTHASAAGDTDRQVQLLAENVLTIAYEGQLTQMVPWIDDLAPVSARTRPWFHVSHAWVLAFAGHLEEVEPHLADAEKTLQIEPDRAEDDPVRGHITAIRGYVAGLRGEWERCRLHATEALRLLPESQVKARAWTTLLLAIVQRQFGRLDAADRAFVEAGRLSQSEDYIPLMTDILWEHSELQRRQGKLHAALASCRRVLKMAERYREQTGRRLPPTGYAYTGIAAVLYEWNDIDGALAYARDGVTLCRRWGMADAVIRSNALLSLTLQAAGQTDAANQAMAEAGRVAETMSPNYLTYVGNARAQLHLVQGRLDRVAAWVEQQGLRADDEFAYIRSAHYLLLARLLVAQGMEEQGDDQSGPALVLLERLQHRYVDAGATGRLIQALILTAVAHQSCGHRRRAMESITEALTLAGDEGYRRSFMAYGATIQPLLGEALRAGTAPATVSALLDLLERKPHTENSALLDPLTERELDVLRLLSTSLTTVEIAETLIVAPSTVRTHVKSIYTKLQVNRRVDAVHRATELRLI